MSEVEIKVMDRVYFYCLKCLEKDPSPRIGQRVNGKCRSCGDAHGANHISGYALFNFWELAKNVKPFAASASDKLLQEAADTIEAFLSDDPRPYDKTEQLLARLRSEVV